MPSAGPGFGQGTDIERRRWYAQNPPPSLLSADDILRAAGTFFATLETYQGGRTFPEVWMPMSIFGDVPVTNAATRTKLWLYTEEPWPSESRWAAISRDLLTAWGVGPGGKKPAPDLKVPKLTVGAPGFPSAASGGGGGGRTVTGSLRGDLIMWRIGY